MLNGCCRGGLQRIFTRIILLIVLLKYWASLRGRPDLALWGESISDTLIFKFHLTVFLLVCVSWLQFSFHLLFSFPISLQGLLATLQSLQILEELPLIEGSELLRYSFAFADSLSLEQRATAMSLCVPYMPDWLQISAVLFDDDEETSNTIYAS